MQLEFFDEAGAVKELKEKLRKIRDTLSPKIKNNLLDPNLVPRDIREEMMQIYDEHGGVYLLSNLTKISINALNN